MEGAYKKEMDELVGEILQSYQNYPQTCSINTRNRVNKNIIIDILEEIRANLPGELKMASEIVEKRKDFIDAGKREYDSKVKQAEEVAKQKVNEHELVQEARKRAAEIIANAESRSKELMRAAAAYCDDAIKRTEVSVDETLEQIKNTRTQFLNAMKEYK